MLRRGGGPPKLMPSGYLRVKAIEKVACNLPLVVHEGKHEYETLQMANRDDPTSDYHVWATRSPADR